MVRRRNPLHRRFLRELKSEAGKYLVIFLLLVFMIGFVSGFLVADGSMIRAYNESFEKYNVEDGNFRTESRINRSMREEIEKEGVTLYDNFYITKKLTNGSHIRIFQNRSQVNLACLMQGRFPEQEGEIAVDRMYADNNCILPGDLLTDENGKEWTVTGLVALPDYSCLFENNGDSMFDAVQFGVGVVTPEEFMAFPKELLDWSYSWKYEDPPETEEEEKERSEELMKAVAAATDLQDFVPRYANQAIIFTGDDMGGDKAMMQILLYIIIAILAFVFAITTANTIQKEASVIGTLLASGYTRFELIRHYMTMPVIVTLLGAGVGNILGYSLFKDVCAAMYYHSYSLPTYVTIWNADAFLLTTVIPVLMMVVIVFAVLSYQLTLSPLKFLRRDLSRGRAKRAVPLPRVLRFFDRFRLRVIFQNLPNYLVLFLGVLFANLLLLFGMLMPELLSNVDRKIKENSLCDYQYILSVPAEAMDDTHKLRSFLKLLEFEKSVETENPDAEKFSLYSLKTEHPDYMIEDVMFYGVLEDSRYINIPSDPGTVYVSSAYAAKYDLSPGDEITLTEAYEDKDYSFTVTGIYDYMGGLSVFMPRSDVNETFELGENYFSGYFSNSEITDIDESCIGTVIDLPALTKITRQLKVSMGGIMYLVDVIALIIFVILIYLLSKIIIEKNAQSISMAKILGYSNGEIGRLYILSTTILYVFFVIVSIPIEIACLKGILNYVIRTSIPGWMEYDVRMIKYLEVIALGILCYAIVAVMELRRIRRIPMDQALKTAE